MPPGPEPELVLAADVGGTKTHVGLFQAGRRRPALRAVAEYASTEYDGLRAILETFLRDQSRRVRTAAIAVAGPVIGGCSRVTNLPWRVCADSLKQRFGWPQVALINDLVAMALAVPYLSARELVALNAKRRRPGRNLALLAPGTGLGAALLVAGPHGYRALASEGGHADWAPTSEEDLDLWRFLHQRFGHVSAERVGAGDGLGNIYRWLASKPQWTPPPWMAAVSPWALPREITRGALEQRDPLCRAALQKFVRLLGAQAGNLVLVGTATGGLFLGGGIPPRILPALQQPDFMETFLDKGRFRDLLATIPVRVITHPRSGLLGAAVHALQTACGKCPAPQT